MKRDAKSLIYRPIDEINFLSIDVETTGLDPSCSRVCEIAYLKFRSGETLDSFTTLVDPQTPIPPEVSRIHNITDDMVSGRPKFSGVAARLLCAMENSVLVAHNAPFDISFLKTEFGRIGMVFPDIPVIDTLKISRKFGKFASNKLGTVAKNLNIQACGWHRASSDVVMVKRVLEHFLLIFKKDGASTLGDLLKKTKGNSFH